MHELSVTQALVDTVESSMNEAGPGLKLKSVKIKIGRLTSIVPDCIKFYFDLVTSEKPAMSGAVLDIELVPMTAACRACGANYSTDAPVFLCPECGSADSDVLTGRELYIESIEVDEPQT